MRLINKLLHVAAFGALMCMMGVVAANVIGRIFFKSPVMGTIEIAGLSGVVVVSVAMGLAQLHERNIAVDIVVGRFPQRLKKLCDIVVHGLSLVAVGFICWAVTASALEAFTLGDVTFMLNIKTYPFRFIWAAGLLLLVGILAHRIYGVLKGKFSK